MKPRSPVDSWNDIACDLARRGHMHAAAATQRRAVQNIEDAKISPEKAAEIHSNYANMLRRIGRYDEAYRHNVEALRSHPDHQSARFNAAIWCMDNWQTGEALLAVNRLLREEPGNPDWRFARACLELQAGNYAQGFLDYDCRIESQHFSCPFWDPRAVRPGHRVLINGEQGLGDTIMFHRFVDMFKARYPDVIVDYVVHQQLAALLDAQRAGAFVGETGKMDEWHLPIMSIPGALGLDAVSGAPYLKPKQRMGFLTPPGTRWRIGLVWRAKSTIKSMTVDETLHGSAKSMPLTTLLELTRIKGAALYGLQHNTTDIADLECGHVVTNLGHMLHDFTDLASFVAQMDVVVSVDTAPAHLAGALGTPVVVALHNGSAWHWGTGDRSEWYDSARILRQPGGWDGAAIVAEVEKVLAAK